MQTGVEVCAVFEVRRPDFPARQLGSPAPTATLQARPISCATVDALSGAQISTAPPLRTHRCRERNGLLTSSPDHCDVWKFPAGKLLHSSVLPVHTAQINFKLTLLELVSGRKALPDKLLVSQQTKNFPVICGTPSFNSVIFEVLNESTFF
jgi:hypothetical protein